MTFLKTLTRAAGLGLCVVALSGTALADPGNGNGGPAATPPGQEKKAETPAAAAPTPAPAPQAAQGQEQKAENQAKQAAKKAEPKPAAKADKPAKAAKPAKPAKAAKADKPAKAAKAAKAAKPAKPAKASKSQSANAHHHVIVCHRTGSLSNPYVVINIPYTAWLNAHSDSTGSHPDLNGNHDIMLKDPASRPGSKDGFTKAACKSSAAPAPTQLTPTTPSSTQTGSCPTTVTTTERVLVGIKHYTGATKNGQRKYVVISPSEKSAHMNGKHADDEAMYETRTVTRTVSGESCAAVNNTSSNDTTNTTSSSNTTNVTSSNTTNDTSNNTSSNTSSNTTSNTTSNTSTDNTTNTDSQTSLTTQTQSSQVSQSTAANGQAPVGGVAGAVSPAGAGQAAKKADKPAGGVLGAIASAPEAVAETATTGTLPFTGIPLWIAALIGVALLGAGLVLRRTA